MSVRKLTAGVFAILAMLGSITGANAQDPSLKLPPADPFAFDPDFRWFEPVYGSDLADIKAKHRAPTGYFGTYDRLRLYSSRPETNNPQASESKIDAGYGGRYEFGYMTQENSGFMFTATDMGVAEADTVRFEAANRVNDVALVENVGQDSFPFEINVPGTQFRFFDVGDSQNIFNYDSYELNKTWRMEPYHYGGILEPMIGIRWMRIQDINQSTRLSSDGSLVNTGNFILPDNLLGADQLLTDQSTVENELFGGQIGFRYLKYRDRFTYSADLRVYAGGSFQAAHANQQELLILFGGPGVSEGDDVTDVQQAATALISEDNQETFVGFDVRGELGYNITKMITIRAGFQIIDVGTGVWRGGLPIGRITGGDRDQDLFMVGGTFGISLNH